MPDQNQASPGGYLVGRAHRNGGIKAINKSTGMPLEMEGGEVVITKPAVKDTTLREFEGEMLTNKQILSRINESGGGVSFAGDKKMPEKMFVTGKKFKFGGEVMDDISIVRFLGNIKRRRGRPVTKKNPQMEIPLPEIQKEAIEHSQTFNQIQSGEINTPEELGKSIAIDHKLSENQSISDNEIVLSPEERQLLYSMSDYTGDGINVHYTTNPGDVNNLIKLGLVEVVPYQGALYIGKDKLYEILPKKRVVSYLKSFQFTENDKLPASKFARGGTIIDNDTEIAGKYKYFKGLKHPYKNAYVLNKAIEELLDSHDNADIDADMKQFIKNYSGYGGLTKYMDEISAADKGIMWEFFTPPLIAQKMWALAYKYGYSGGSVMEPSAGVGEFIQYAPEQSNVSAIELNRYSARICKLLYPEINLTQGKFESMFIKNRDTIKDKTTMLPKFDLVIGNPPYGDFSGREAGMGEDRYTRAQNYVEYFIFRGLDILKPGGLLIYIVGAEVANGGVPFLDTQTTAAKKAIAEKSILLDAYRLPNGVFERTDVLSDILVIRKK